MKTILEALSFVQKHLNAPKSQYNSFGKYKYRNVEDIMQGLKSCLPDGAAVTVSDTIVQMGDRIYVKATATFHYQGESIAAEGYARESDQKKGMDSSQLTGACSSYARKYALGGLLAVDDNKDADHHVAEERPKPAPVDRESVERAAEINEAYDDDDFQRCRAILEGARDKKSTVWSMLSDEIKKWMREHSNV